MARQPSLDRTDKPLHSRWTKDADATLDIVQEAKALVGSAATTER
jgi:hypothetical protein